MTWFPFAHRMPMPLNDPNHDVAVAALLRRLASAAGVHMYEMEMVSDVDYVCQMLAAYGA